MHYLIIALSLVLAGELEVDGNLNVTGDINSPTIDALVGMKLERIYKYFKETDASFSFTVPEGRIWNIIGNIESNYIKIVVNGNPTTILDNDGGQYKSQ